jgi:hypothetical protein
VIEFDVLGFDLLRQRHELRLDLHVPLQVSQTLRELFIGRFFAVIMLNRLVFFVRETHDVVPTLVVQVAVRVVSLGARVLDHDEHSWMNQQVGVRENPEIFNGIDNVWVVDVSKDDVGQPCKWVNDTDHDDCNQEQRLF